jgi:trimethylamine--corrinoid protein Co-methyltransferase
LQASDPHNTIHLGGTSLNFMPVGGPPGFSDLDRGKQTGTRAAAQDFMRLCQSFDAIHVSGPCVEAQDLALNERHLWVSLDNLTLATKPVFTWARGTPISRDGFEMIRLARGLSEDEFRQQHHTFTVINTNSPLQLDIPDAERPDGLCRGQPDRHHHAVHAGRCHGAGDHCGCAGAAACGVSGSIW